LPPGGELRKYWDEVNAQLLSQFAILPEDEWLQRHKAMSEEDYAKDPTRNRLGVLLSRTNQMSYHLWQITLALKWRSCGRPDRSEVCFSKLGHYSPWLIACSGKIATDFETGMNYFAEFAPSRSDASCDRGYLDDVSGPALTEIGQPQE
jgi:hypothetical protein